MPAAAKTSPSLPHQPFVPHLVSEERLQSLLIALECPFLPADVKARLMRIWRYGGEARVVLTIRAIKESEGNEAALNEPIIVNGVSWVITCKPEWANRGLEWIAAFDRVPLVDLLRRFESLRIFKPETMAYYYSRSLRNHLWDIFEAAPAPVPQHPLGRKGYVYKRGPRKSTIERIAKERSKANANVMAMPIADGQ